MNTVIEQYQDLLETALAAGEPQRLLVVLLRVDAVHQRGADGTSEALQDEGQLSPAMAHDFELDAGLTLDALVAEADRAAPGWRFMLTTVLASRTGRMPTSAEAEPCLKRMAQAIMSGESLDQYAVFDRDGNGVRLEAASA